MSCRSPECFQLRRTIAELVRSAHSDLLPLHKLELLCTQLGTAEHWLNQPKVEVDPPHHISGRLLQDHPLQCRNTTLACFQSPAAR